MELRGISEQSEFFLKVKLSPKGTSKIDFLRTTIALATRCGISFLKFLVLAKVLKKSLRDSGIIPRRYHNVNHDAYG